MDRSQCERLFSIDANDKLTLAREQKGDATTATRTPAVRHRDPNVRPDQLLPNSWPLNNLRVRTDCCTCRYSYNTRVLRSPFGRLDGLALQPLREHTRWKPLTRLAPAPVRLYLLPYLRYCATIKPQRINIGVSGSSYPHP
jgi:hypothetical protein